MKRKLSRKTTKHKHFYVWLGMYRQQVMVILGPRSHDEVRKYIGKLEVKEDFKNGINALPEEKIKKGVCFTIEGFPPCIVFPSYDKKDLEDVACIVHEASHAVDSIMQTCLLQGEYEALAYMHEYLFTHVKDGLDKITK